MGLGWIDILFPLDPDTVNGRSQDQAWDFGPLIVSFYLFDFPSGKYHLQNISITNKYVFE